MCELCCRQYSSTAFCSSRRSFLSSGEIGVAWVSSQSPIGSPGPGSFMPGGMLKSGSSSVMPRL
jgi:hypothetical protein